MVGLLEGSQIAASRTKPILLDVAGTTEDVSAILQDVVRDGDPVETEGLQIANDPILKEEQDLEWVQLIEDFKDVFPDDQPGAVPDRAVQLEINLEPGTTPASKPAYRLSPPEMDELKAQLTVLLEKGLILQSTSSWESPVLFAPKANGGIWMCLDYRALNKGTVKDMNPIPRVDEIFDRLQGAHNFSTPNLWSGYYQIKVRVSDIPKTCIRTRYGSFEFLMMLFDVTNAPSMFQALMNTTFRDLADVYVMCYLDEILIYRKTPGAHKRPVQEVLRRLRQENLYCKRSKRHFNQR
jgi:Reverse transcriptase (RNA-dependent DNA polymerase)